MPMRLVLGPEDLREGHVVEVDCEGLAAQLRAADSPGVLRGLAADEVVARSQAILELACGNRPLRRSAFTSSPLQEEA